MSLKAGRVGVNPKYVGKDGSISVGSEYELPIASSSTLGGIKVIGGSGLDIDEDTGHLRVHTIVPDPYGITGNKVLCFDADVGAIYWGDAPSGESVLSLTLADFTKYSDGYFNTTSHAWVDDTKYTYVFELPKAYKKVGIRMRSASAYNIRGTITTNRKIWGDINIGTHTTSNDSGWIYHSDTDLPNILVIQLESGLDMSIVNFTQFIVDFYN